MGIPNWTMGIQDSDEISESHYKQTTPWLWVRQEISETVWRSPLTSLTSSSLASSHRRGRSEFGSQQLPLLLHYH
jgi:hypothetical protein